MMIAGWRSQKYAFSSSLKILQVLTNCCTHVSAASAQLSFQALMVEECQQITDSVVYKRAYYPIRYFLFKDTCQRGKTCAVILKQVTVSELLQVTTRFILKNPLFQRRQVPLKARFGFKKWIKTREFKLVCIFQLALKNLSFPTYNITLHWLCFNKPHTFEVTMA